MFAIGINSFERNKNKDYFYNTFSIYDYKLNLLTDYKKVKLVPFGEFLPFEKFLRKLGFKSLTNNYQSFSSGKSREILSINNKDFNLKILPLICYEIIYSGKIFENSNFDLIINISEDGWFGNSIGPYQHFSHSIFRSVEEGKNLIRSANNGISAHINPLGQIVKKVESTEKGTIEIKNFKKLSKTIFNQYGNKIFFYFLLFYISLIFFLKKKGSWDEKKLFIH